MSEDPAKYGRYTPPLSPYHYPFTASADKLQTAIRYLDHLEALPEVKNNPAIKAPLEKLHSILTN